MKISIRTAKKEDASSMLALIKELALFEKDPEAVEVNVKDLERDGFGENPLFHCFVAEVDNKIVGMALCYPRYSTWKGKTIHLEDLIVNNDYRGHKIGGKLLDEVVSYGHANGVRRIEWAVLDWNEPAIAFYEKKGARVLRDWDVVQLDEKGIENYISKLS